MPNPLMNRQLNTSKNRRPEPIEPDVEEYEYESPNIPYRGGVDHGVQSNNAPEPPQKYDPDYVTEYASEPTEPTPVPVKIVQSSGREIKAWRTFRTYATNNSLISDEVPEQVKVTIHNMSTDTVVYVGDSRDNANEMHGYPLAVNAELTITTTQAVYGSSADGTQQPISVVREYVIRED